MKLCIKGEKNNNYNVITNFHLARANAILSNIVEKKNVKNI